MGSSNVAQSTEQPAPVKFEVKALSFQKDDNSEINSVRSVKELSPRPQNIDEMVQVVKAAPKEFTIHIEEV